MGCQKLLVFCLVNFLNVKSIWTEETPEHRDPFMQDLLNKFDRKCLQDNSIDLLMSVKIMQNCFNSKGSEVTDALSDQLRPGSREPGDVIAEHVCRQPELEICFVRFKNTIKLCLNPEGQDFFNDIISSVYAGHDYVCKDGGKKLQELNFKEVHICMNQANVSSCNVKNIKASFNEENCKILENYNNCMVSAMEKCPNKAASDFFSGLFSAMFNATPCHSYISSASYLSINLVMLANCLMLIFCKFI